MISGEQFQQLAEIGLYSDINCIIRDQVLAFNQNIIQIDELSVEDIKKYNKIFVYTHCLPHFFNKFFKYLNPGTVLITHNSDDCITENFSTYLNDNTISKWYCQNKLISHPKLFSLPIGIANSQWPHGDQQLIKNIKELCKQKTNLIFKNFDQNTNKDERIHCDNITNKNGIYMSPKTAIKEYWLQLASSCFVISPAGNGIDCHRILECLYLRTVPIVLNHESLEQFKHLPILFLDSWEEVTISFLQSKLNNFIDVDWNIAELDINFWKQII
jgi:hypothetical protein